MNFETLVDLLYNHRPNDTDPGFVERGSVLCHCGILTDWRRWARHVAEEVKLLEQEDK